MNKQRFIEYLRKPADLNNQTLEDLEDIVTDFPYFQSARTLLAKASKIKKAKHAGKYVASAAIYATDRALLKRYLNDELIFLSPISVHESHEADHDRDRSAEIKEKKSTSIQNKLKHNPRMDIKPPTRSTISNVEVKEEDEQKSRPNKPVGRKTSPAKPATKDRKEPPREKPAPTRDKISSDELTDGPSAADQSNSLDKLIDELYHDMEKLKVSREKFMEYERQFEEEEAVDEALKKATEKKSDPKSSAKKEAEPTRKPAQKEEEKSKVGQEPVKDESKSSEKTDDKQEESKERDDKKSADSKKTESAEQEATPVKAQDDIPKKPSESRSARGNRAKSSSTKASGSPSTAKKTTSAKSTTKKKPGTAKKTTSSTSKSTGKKTSTKKSEGKSPKKDDKNDDKGDPRKTEQEAIISNFIKNNPSISPADSKTKNEADLSGESTAFHPEIASEYLAEIYLKQGKKERAVEIYKALMLKFPEKKSYFAGLIEKLK